MTGIEMVSGIISSIIVARCFMGVTKWWIEDREEMLLSPKDLFLVLVAYSIFVVFGTIFIITVANAILES